jgi:arylsulfatase A-like enzyme
VKSQGYKTGVFSKWRTDYISHYDRIENFDWWPSVIEKYSVNDQLAISLDIMPTIVSLTKANLPQGHQLDGISLIPTLLGDKNTHRELFWRPGGLDEFSTTLPTEDRPKAMRTGQWKLVVSPYYKNISLYDLSNDIAEQKNVAKQHPEIVSDMTSKVKAWEQEVLPYLTYKVKPKI